ncbi:MAG: hypothetical protein AABX01_06730 [Candidatus Micrarchaeota archaeon]
MHWVGFPNRAWSRVGAYAMFFGLALMAITFIAAVGLKAELQTLALALIMFGFAFYLGNS